MAATTTEQPSAIQKRLLAGVADALGREVKPVEVAKIRPLPAALTNGPEQYAPPGQRLRETGLSVDLPDYVTHDPEATRAAQLSAQTQLAEYERLAVEIEAMGRDFRNVAVAVLERTRDTAKLFREEGARRFNDIQEASKIANRTLEAVNKFREVLKNVPDDPEVPLMALEEHPEVSDENHDRYRSEE